MVAKYLDKGIFHLIWSGIIGECQRMFGKYFGPYFANKKCEYEGNNFTIFKPITSYAIFCAMCIGQMVTRVL